MAVHRNQGPWWNWGGLSMGLSSFVGFGSLLSPQVGRQVPLAPSFGCQINWSKEKIKDTVA